MISRALKRDLVITDLKNPYGNILSDYLAFGVFVQAFIQQCHLSLLLLFVLPKRWNWAMLPMSNA